MSIYSSLKAISHKLLNYEIRYIDISELLLKDVLGNIIQLVHQKHKKRHLNLAIYGYTNGGKTTFLNEFVPEFRLFLMNQKIIKDGFGILHIRIHPQMTCTGLYTTILDELKWSYPQGKKNREIYLPFLEKACRTRHVKYIILDEVSELYHGDYEKQVKYILHAFKFLPEITMAKFILVGTPKLKEILYRDIETSGRYYKIEFPRFRLNGKRWKVLQSFLKTIADQVYNDINVDCKTLYLSQKTIRNLGRWSFGKIGVIVLIIEEGLKIAYTAGSPKLTYNDLLKAKSVLVTSDILKDEDIESSLINENGGYIVPKILEGFTKE